MSIAVSAVSTTGISSCCGPWVSHNPYLTHNDRGIGGSPAPPLEFLITRLTSAALNTWAVNACERYVGRSLFVSSCHESTDWALHCPNCGKYAGQVL